MNTLKNIQTPQLTKRHSGKVREIFQYGNSLLIASTDRISCFNKVLPTAQPNKGVILNQLAAFWFEKTAHIVPNAFVRMVDPCMSLMKEAKPIRVEMIVRGYLTGSIWRAYRKGERTFSGVTLPDGMEHNQAFPEPILTPTTKDEFDTRITPEEIVSSGLVTADVYEQMCDASIKLFKFGSEWCEERGLILVDTKYEFGTINGELTLIDEVHTPDSSRFWRQGEYAQDPSKASWMDKEYIRQTLLDEGEEPKTLRDVPYRIVHEASQRYQWVYEAITGKSFIADSRDPSERLYKNLVEAGIIRDAYVGIVMGSKGDFEHAMQLKDYLDPYGVMVDIRVASAHKNGEVLVPLCDEYNNALEPGAVIAIAGRSNGLGGALSANLAIPVVNCPPFKDKADIMLNLASSVMMPSKTPATTAIEPSNAVHAALRSLGLARLRRTFTNEIQAVKEGLARDDAKMQEAFRKQTQGKVESIENRGVLA